jgi:hypothetical protein
LNTRGFMKTESSGCGISDSSFIRKSKESKSTNGNASICRTVTCSSPWSFKIRSKEKMPREDKRSLGMSMLTLLITKKPESFWNWNS